LGRSFSGVTTLAGGYRKERLGLGLNLYAGDAGISAKSGVPDGTRHPVAFLQPRKTGGLAARNSLYGAGAVTASGVLGKNAQASLSGAGSLSGVAQLIVSMVATLTGAGAITNAALLAYLQLAASLAGSGNLLGATQALANAVALLGGSGGAAGSTATAKGSLAAQIVVTGTGLTAESVASAVWSKLIESGYSAEDIMRILTAYAAGNVSGGPGSPTFKSLDGSKTRIGGTADADGNRTRTTLDGA